jgi:hypothetical protein
MNRPPSSNPLRAPEQAGLSSVFASQTTARARAVEVKWRWPITLALLTTVPSFYVELLHESAPLFAVLSYLLAALTMGGALLHVGLRSRRSGSAWWSASSRCRACSGPRTTWSRAAARCTG